jgi:hypothetical protein
MWAPHRKSLDPYATDTDAIPEATWKGFQEKNLKFNVVALWSLTIPIGLLLRAPDTSTRTDSFGKFSV